MTQPKAKVIRIWRVAPPAHKHNLRDGRYVYNETVTKNIANCKRSARSLISGMNWHWFYRYEILDSESLELLFASSLIPGLKKMDEIDSDRNSDLMGCRATC